MQDRARQSSGSAGYLWSQRHFPPGASPRVTETQASRSGNVAREDRLKEFGLFGLKGEAREDEMVIPQTGQECAYHSLYSRRQTWSQKIEAAGRSELVLREASFLAIRES